MKELLKKLLSFENDEERIEFESNIIQMNFIRKIKNIMKEKNISIYELSQETNIHILNLKEFFYCDVPIDLKFLVILQRYFNIKIEINILEE